ncbi:MAG: Transcriptional regulator, AraC family [Polyangiaceae bacterium]|jgi:AraC-like DNA-binding protein|nr:Transcriptional regulator, AraC family [Polyangiaceae bacterium]
MPEIIKLVRRATCPGVELVHITDSPRIWGHLNTLFSFGTMASWRGRASYRRQNLPLGPGHTFTFDPGEFFRGVPDDAGTGSFRVIELMPDLFADLCREEDRRAPMHFTEAIRPAPAALATALDALERALLGDTDALEQQSCVVELAHAASLTVLERGAPRSSKRPAPLGPCERLRELLHSSEASTVSLAAFAREADVSQFQLLRAFKRRYGFPPHAYGLHVRVERGRRLLRLGRTVAEAAAAGDFTDQSHFTRHFRRIWGVTPGHYASLR